MKDERARPEYIQRKRAQRFTDEQLLEQYDKGLTNKQISQILGVTQGAISYRIEGLGLINNVHKNIPRYRLICPHCGKDIEDVKTEVVT